MFNKQTKEREMITEIKKENEEKAELVAKCYNNIDDMFNDLRVKLELYANLSLENNELSYSLAMYSDELKILLRAIQLKI